MEKKIEKKIGVSYASRNREILNEIEKQLSVLGVKILRYDEVLNVKDNIQRFMRTLTKMDMNLLLLSKEYFESPFCLYELAMLVKKPEKLIVVYLESSIQIETLIENAQRDINSVFKRDTQWINAECEKINYKEVFLELSVLLKEKYLTYGEIADADGVKQLVGKLDYTPDLYLSKLNEILEKEDFYEREKHLIEYLEFATANEIYNFYKALSYEKQGYIQGAVFFLRQAISINPNYVMAYVKILDLAIKYPEKVACDEELFNYLDGRSGLSRKDRSMILKAKAMFILKKTRETETPNKIHLLRRALEYLDEAGICSGMKDAVIYNNEGLIYEELGEIELAEQSYLEAVKLEPEYYQAMSSLALLYDKYYGEIELARNIYEKCLSINPNYKLAQSNYALLMEKVDSSIAIEMDLRMLLEPHKHMDFITNLALLLEEEWGANELAGIIYRILLEREPKSIAKRFNMGNYLRRNGGGYDEVRAYLMPVYEALPSNDMVIFSLALLEIREGNLEAAEGFCDKAICINKKYLPAVFLKRFLEEQKGEEVVLIIERLENDIRYFKTCKEVGEQHLAFLYNFVGILHYRLGNREEAKKWRVLAINANCRLKKETDDNFQDYGFDILEYAYTNISNGRIYKNRNENLMVDSYNENRSYLMELLQKK